MFDWWAVVLLGLLEGISAFLPISATGHLRIAADLRHFDPRLRDTFTIFIQFGAVLAVLGFYARDLLAQAQALRRDPAIRRFWLGIALAVVPAAVAGFLLRGWITGVLFHTPVLIAGALIGGGIVLIGSDYLPQRAHDRPD